MRILNIVAVLEDMFPGSINGEDYELRDNGDDIGPYIHEWHLPDPEPSRETLEAVSVQLEQETPQ
jgi:hypothetical protein